MNTIKKFPVWFSQQRLSGRIFLVVLGLLVVICTCSLLATVFTRPQQQAPTVTATYKGADSFAVQTWTPTPTNLPILTPTPFPTRTALPTGLPTQIFETATTVVLPATLSPATAGILVLITAVNKELEYVDIQNAGSPTVNLKGWVLVSEAGNQSCKLRGILEPKQVLRIWAATGQVGLSCEFRNPIWLNEEPDPAVLYNPKGEEVSRYP
ncbi:MAG TPA: lamin tail domain-containing protein [Anaerolineales bacterium]|nr:lamin tail domain-containing protein [Anaerolineales bacterium]